MNINHAHNFFVVIFKFDTPNILIRIPYRKTVHKIELFPGLPLTIYGEWAFP